MALPNGAATPASALGLNPGNDALRCLRIAKRNKHLIEFNIIQNLIPGSGQTIGETGGILTVGFFSYTDCPTALAAINP